MDRSSRSSTRTNSIRWIEVAMKASAEGAPDAIRRTIRSWRAETRTAGAPAADWRQVSRNEKALHRFAKRAAPAALAYSIRVHNGYIAFGYFDAWERSLTAEPWNRTFIPVISPRPVCQDAASLSCAYRSRVSKRRGRGIGGRSLSNARVCSSRRPRRGGGGLRPSRRRSKAAQARGRRYWRGLSVETQ